jgi:hypothetical protein
MGHLNSTQVLTIWDYQNRTGTIDLLGVWGEAPPLHESMHVGLDALQHCYFKVACRRAEAVLIRRLPVVK